MRTTPVSKVRILTPVNKLPDYKGPRTHHAIMKKIHEESISEGKDVSFSYIERVIRLFFSANGFPYYFKQFKSFSLIGIGRWLVTKPGKTYFRKKQKAKNKHKLFITERQRQKRIKKAVDRDALHSSRNDELDSHAYFVKKFNELNLRLISIGQKPWSWKDFCIRKKRRKFITWGTIPYNHWNW